MPSTMKIFVLFAALAAVGLSSPTTEFMETDNMVPETEQIEQDTPVSAITSQFNQIQDQIKAGMEITPGVKATLTKMEKMIGTWPKSITKGTIEASIIDAHNSDQKLVNAKVDGVKAVNSITAPTIKSLHARAKSLRGSISLHNTRAGQLKAVAKIYAKSIVTYTNAVNSKISWCCKYKQAAVPDVVYTPAFAVCDFKSSTGKDCITRASSALNLHTNKLLAAYSEYDRFKRTCSARTTSMNKAHKDMTNQDNACDNRVVSVDVPKKIVDQGLPALRRDWNSAQKTYNSQFDAAKRTHDKAIAGVRSRATDRKNEWISTQKIKCMLKHYVAGGTFNQKALNACNKGLDNTHLNIKYPALPAKLKWVLGSFTALVSTSADRRTCRTYETVNENRRCTGITGSLPLPICRNHFTNCLLYTSPSPRDRTRSRMPSSA
eukprot:TRINITY_DN1915_c0_g1_i3.p1 TRINITY_DN1915_c0_g1~~TRINITY_DN1915_c0_g1_i3.p1  ORF type:complete len:434 (+),score=204.22 TRINITY_DN1915_c0_g1_i3:195-1496(+)